VNLFSRNFLSLAVLALMASGANATGSIFSGLGVGVLEDVNSSRAIGMGNTGLALEDSNTINFANPALLSTLHRSRITIGGYISRQWMTDPNSSDTDDWAQLEYFGIAIAIKKGWGLGFHLTPYSRVEFKYAWTGTLVSPLPGVPNADYLETYQGIGGLTRAALSLAWAPKPGLSVGIAGNLTWGDVQEYRTSVFNAPGYSDVQFTKSKQYLGYGGTIGIIVKPTPKLVLGATFEPQVPLQLDRIFSYTSGDSIVTSQQDLQLAARFGFGASYQIAPKWLVAGQVAYSDWSSVENLPGGSSTYRNSNNVGMGAEWTPGTWDSDAFFQRFQYRFGLRRESTYLVSDGSGVDVYTASAGLSYPFHQGVDRFDLGFEFGRRGNLDSNGGQENTFKFRLGLNLGESWFQRSKPPWAE
jgi:long-subunit fatty acid transport protein